MDGQGSARMDAGEHQAWVGTFGGDPDDPDLDPDDTHDANLVIIYEHIKGWCTI
jgi:hypothetical protein